MKQETEARTHHRAQQLAEIKRNLNNRMRSVTRLMEAIVRQFIEVGNRWKIETLDPIVGAPIPYVVQMFDQIRRWFKGAEFCALVLGTVVAAGLSTVTFVGNRIQVFAIASLLALLVSGVLVGTMLMTARVNWKNPDSRRVLTLWTAGFGAALTVALVSVLYLRFVANSQQLALLAIGLTAFEASVLGLTATFHATASLYDWSRVLHNQHEALEAEWNALETEMLNAHVELTMLSGASTSLADAIEQAHEGLDSEEEGDEAPVDKRGGPR